MQAILGRQVAYGNNYCKKKEKIGQLVLIAKLKGKLNEVCIARFYKSRTARQTSTVYCTFFLCGGSHYTSGRGASTGHVHNKTSAALANAIKKADITLDTEIAGKSVNSMQEALLAVATAVGADTSDYIFTE